MKNTNLRFIGSAFALGLAAALLFVPSVNVSRGRNDGFRQLIYEDLVWRD